MRVRVGRILGHDIALDLVSFGVIVLLVWSAYRDHPRLAAVWLGAIFLMVLIHELGHAVTIRRLTGEHTLIVIGWGGLTVSYRQKRPGQQLLISLAGPAAGFLAGLVAWIIARSIDPSRPFWPPWQGATGGSTGILFLNLFVFVCFFWSAFNLIPAIPLDGGKALRAALIAFGMWPFKARRVTRWIAVAIAVAGALWLLREDADRFYWIIVLMIGFAVLDEVRLEGW